ncbi:MAG: NUDIX domain-containing protein [Actinomycetota bacterium]|nr:NUDIX domain-containing protein [Actinomycetota bacterium]
MKTSAGLLLFRRTGASGNDVEILLAHPGGPFWAKKDQHGWSIPKGELDEGENPVAAARREFQEELGHPSPDGEYWLLVELGGPKRISVWALEADFDVTSFGRNPVSTTEVEWPPRSGKRVTIPEIDRIAWFNLAEAENRLHKGQVPIAGHLADVIRRSEAGF